jgi:hypothetical protein
MTKQDKIGVVLRKLDYLWSVKGYTFCKAVKEFLKASQEFDDNITDDEIINNIKDLFPDEKKE